jgi:hypothetical protein
MSAIEERLRTAASDTVEGEWLDVVRRSEQLRRGARRRRGALAFAAVLVLGVPALAFADRLTEFLVVSSDESKITWSWVSDTTAHNIGGKDEVRLDRSVANRPFSDRYVSPLAIPSPDGRSLIYHSFVDGLRVRDLESGVELALERGSRSAAWRADGTLAYAKGQIGHVFVREQLDARPQQWSVEPSDYTVLAWAGKTLIVGAATVSQASVQRLFGKPDQAEQGVWALDGMSRARRLPLGGVLAMSPSGELVVGTETSVTPEDVPLTAVVRVVRVADGKVVAELDLPPVINPERAYSLGSELMSGGGSWAGDHIVVGYRRYEDDRHIAKLVVLRLEDNRLEPVHVFELEEASAVQAGLSRQAALEGPRFLDDGGRDFVTWSAGSGGPVFLRCDRVEKRCTKTAPLPRDGAFLIENPSRPLAE